MAGILFMLFMIYRIWKTARQLSTVCLWRRLRLSAADCDGSWLCVQRHALAAYGWMELSVATRGYSAAVFGGLLLSVGGSVCTRFSLSVLLHGCLWLLAAVSGHRKLSLTVSDCLKLAVAVCSCLKLSVSIYNCTCTCTLLSVAV